MALGFLQREAYTEAREQEVKVLRKLHFDFGDMALALVLWMCSLPLVGLLVVPFWGMKVGAVVAVVLFFVAMAICWGVCSWKIFNPKTKGGETKWRIL
jgi:hypothetical protein